MKPLKNILLDYSCFPKKIDYEDDYVTIDTVATIVRINLIIYSYIKSWYKKLVKLWLWY